MDNSLPQTSSVFILPAIQLEEKGPPASSWDGCGSVSPVRLDLLTGDHVDLATF